MDQITQSPQFKPFMKKLAIMAAVLTLVALVLKLRGVHVGDTLLIVGMGTLSIVMFMLGWLFPCPAETGRPIWNFAMRLTGFSLSADIIGVLFLIMHWPGGKTIFMAGIVCLVISGLAWLWYFVHRRNYYE